MSSAILRCSESELTFTVDDIILVVTTVTEALEASECVLAALLTPGEESFVFTLVDICPKITDGKTQPQTFS